MRNAVGIFGLACGAIVVALVARYGYKTTDVETDAWIMAFFFGAIASFALAGHAIAVRLWTASKFWSIAAGLVAVVALGLNLSNSLGAIAGRADTVQTAAVEHNRKIKAAEAELKRLQGVRSAMPAFDFADQATVDAAKRAADAATKSREAECKNRGNLCREREADERAAADKLAAAARNKAASERATKLEADMAAQNGTLSKLGPAATVNAQGSALARLFRLPDDEAGFVATAQQFGTAAIVEFIILICFVAWELMGRNVSPRPTRSEQRVDETTETRQEPVVIEHEPAPVIAPPPRPKLVSTSNSPTGSVRDALAANLKGCKGQRVEIAEIGERYRAECKAAGKQPASAGEFLSGVKHFCRMADLRMREIDGHIYILDVQLKDQQNEATA